jgi:hypothetical protein
MVRLPTLGSLAVLTAVVGGCALASVLREPDPIDPVEQSRRETELEIHRIHHRIAVEAHESAVLTHQQMGNPPPTPIPPVP